MWRSILLLLLLAAPAYAQFPGELAGRVVSAETGEAVDAATLELPTLGRTTVSDATGAFRLRGLEPGLHPVIVRRIGYGEQRETVQIQNGRTTRLSVRLSLLAVELQGIEVAAVRRRAPGERIERAVIQASGARTAGDVVRLAPGAVIRGEGADGRQTVSIRGSGADAVLVLVDGIPINDPVTGEADLSTIPAHAIESVSVLVGSHSARYGPRAEAGVVLIRTRDAGRGRGIRLLAGSLGETGGSGEWGAAAAGVVGSVGGHARRVQGGFTHERVPGIDPRPVRRANADLTEWGGWGSVRAEAGGGELRLRAGAEGIERGLPGKGYAPSVRARQSLDRTRGSAAWRRTREAQTLAISLGAVSQAVRYADPDPPFGLPYDDTTRVRSLEVRAELERIGTGGLRGYGTGLEGRLQQVRSGVLSSHAPRTRGDYGLFLHGTVGHTLGSTDLELTAEGRVDRDDLAGEWYLNRSVTARVSAGPVLLHLANRSGYSPPSLGDQFFREGVAVAPNPDLRPERIPSEWEAGVSLQGSRVGVSAGGGVRGYLGDVKGMIVWLPDFRFVWSPQNTDVRRHGAEVWGEVLWPERALRFAGSYSLAVITYDRAGDADDVQVAYRPRHSAQARAEWTPGPWRLGAGALLTGTRYPAPARLNALPRFWTAEANMARRWRAGAVDLTTALYVDRLFNETDSMIFGFPEAGRRIRLELVMARADRP